MKQDVRQKIVETASRLFYQNGYNLTGINEIIREAGIAKATLYHHFKSKDDICLAYLQYKNRFFLEEIGTFARGAETGKPQILAIFDFLSQFFEDKAFNGCWCINTVSEIPKDNARVIAELRAQKDAFLALLESLVTENFPGKPQAEQKVVSKQVYLLYEGAIAESNLHGAAWPIETARELLDKILT